MNSDRNGWGSTKRAQMLYFNCGLSTKARKQRLKKKIERHKKIYNILKIYKICNIYINIY